jgi:hypothetical protein
MMWIYYYDFEPKMFEESELGVSGYPAIQSNIAIAKPNMNHRA